MTALKANLWRIAGLIVLAGIGLQVYFLARVALMTVVDPQSTTFQRSEMWRLATSRGQLAWSQSWRDYPQIAGSLKRAVIASEDAGFADHSGVEWDALEAAWERNLRAQAQADQLNARLEARAAASGKPVPPRVTPVRIVGGSTITQQLAKNLFMSSERSLLRKGQEVVITFMLEACLSKARILEIYLNNVEWGEGVFGAQAASRHYFRANADQLGTAQAARLAVMLPAPKRFEKRPRSAYLTGRAGVVMGRMGAVELP